MLIFYIHAFFIFIFMLYFYIHVFFIFIFMSIFLYLCFFIFIFMLIFYIHVSFIFIFMVYFSHSCYLFIFIFMIADSHSRFAYSYSRFYFFILMVLKNVPDLKKIMLPFFGKDNSFWSVESRICSDLIDCIWSAKVGVNTPSSTC